KLLRQARQLETPEKNLAELRDEAVACMGDFVGLKPTLLKGSSFIHSMALQPAGGQIALGLSDGTVLVRERNGGVDGARLPGHTGPILSLSFAADGKRLASGDQNGTIHVWQASSDGTWSPQQRLQIEPRPLRISKLLEAR